MKTTGPFNDGALDIYVPAGGISAPKEVATIGDA